MALDKIKLITMRFENTSCTHTVLVSQHGHVIACLNPRQGAELELDQEAPVSFIGACEDVPRKKEAKH